MQVDCTKWVAAAGGGRELHKVVTGCMRWAQAARGDGHGIHEGWAWVAQGTRPLLHERQGVVR